MENHCTHGFAPEYDIDLGLQKTIEWFSDKENLKKVQSEGFTMSGKRLYYQAV